MKKKKILLIGGLNKKNLPRGGEEFKNRILEFFLDKQYKTKTIDTYHWKFTLKTFFLIFFSTFVKSYDVIVISASSLSSYRLIQLLNLRPSRLKKTIYFVLGGFFPKGISTKKYDKKYYFGLKNIIVQGQTLKTILNQHGLIDNVTVIPNFKPVEQTYINPSGDSKGVIKFVFLSSISFSKGVELIFDATKILIEKSTKSFKIEFWGPIEPEYRYRFNMLMEKYPQYCVYRGYLDILSNPAESYSLLSKYDCMLFPTFFEGEGFPGVVLDAYIAGLPVVASDWNMNREVVAEGKTGFLFESNNADALAGIMLKIIEDPKLIDGMRSNCNKEALKYEVNNVLHSHLTKIIDGD